MFEVDRDIGDVCWNGKAAGFEELALPLLRGGVVDLEDAKIGIGAAVSEGIEACTEKNILRNALGDSTGECVFGVATACYKEGAKGDGERTIRAGGSTAKFFGIRGSEDRDSDGIVENKWRRIVELVRGATQGHAKGSSGWAGVLHDKRL
jgi:hypothetical protein